MTRKQKNRLRRKNQPKPPAEEILLIQKQRQHDRELGQRRLDKLLFCIVSKQKGQL